MHIPKSADHEAAIKLGHEINEFINDYTGLKKKLQPIEENATYKRLIKRREDLMKGLVYTKDMMLLDENDKVITIKGISIQRVKDLPMLNETTDDDEEWARKTNLIFESLEDK